MPGSGDPLEKEMTTYSSVLAWEIPWPEELGRLQFMGLQKIQWFNDNMHLHHCWGQPCSPGHIHIWADTMRGHFCLITRPARMCPLFPSQRLGESECVSRSVVADSATPWTVARQAPLSMEFSRQEYWSGLPFPSPGGLPKPGIEPRSPSRAAGRFLTIWATREA